MLARGIINFAKGGRGDHSKEVWRKTAVALINVGSCEIRGMSGRSEWPYFLIYFASEHLLVVGMRGQHNSGNNGGSFPCDN